MTSQGHKKEIRKAVILGAGNLAWHLGHHLIKAGIRVVQVFNRTPEQGELLAVQLGTTCTSMLNYLNKKADIYIVAVSENAIESILNSGCFSEKQLVVHTAGSVSMDVFSGKVENYGVLYPLQTFTKGKPIDLSDTPLFIEASSAENLNCIEHLALKLSKHVYAADSEKRTYIHLAAVIASNFTNHLLMVAEKVLKEKNLSIGLLQPLIEETISKAYSLSPQLAQTGPAIRGNKEVIARHMAMLEKHPEIRELYRIITKSIGASVNPPCNTAINN